MMLSYNIAFAKYAHSTPNQAPIMGNILGFHAFGVTSCCFLDEFFAATFEMQHNVSGMSQKMSFVCFDTRRIQMWNQNFCISNIRADAPKIQTLNFVIIYNDKMCGTM